jgi:c-di-GMP-binding flagellar brake protein YcgR
VYRVIITGLLFFTLIVWLFYFYDKKIKFYSVGFDSKFSFSEINLLWRLSQLCEVDEPVALFWSVPSLNKCMRLILADARTNGTENSAKIQNFLSKLYKFRTNVELSAQKKKGLDSTKYLSEGQRLRILLPGHGVFSSEVVNNGHALIIKLPVQKNIITVGGNEWLAKKISVYFWRKGDASYVFDTTVVNSGVFRAIPVLYVAPSQQLFRTQKRRSVRCSCSIYAQLFFITSQVTNFNLVETLPGYRCLVEDISEDGAMIRVGGEGRNNIQIKIQFFLGDATILMYGIVRSVEYNKTLNQSRLHFECIHLEQEMRNAILSFVYNILPDDQKEIFDALSQTEEDAEDETDQKLAQEMILPQIEATTEDIERILELPVQDDETRDQNTEI